MSLYDDLLEAVGAKSYDDLNPVEQKTFIELLDKYETGGVLTVEDIKKAVVKLRVAVDTEIAKTPYKEKDKMIFLQARILNYILLEAIVTSPERAKEALKNTVKGYNRKA